METVISNARLVLPDRLIENGWIVLEHGRIVELGEGELYPRSGVQLIDAAGCFVLPGLIDLHCDAIERIYEPRPGVNFDILLAALEADTRLALCGITTEFHAISLDDNEFGVRSESFMHDFRHALSIMRHQLFIRHKLHARLEVTSDHGCGIGIQMMQAGECELVSLMDHSPGQGQYRDEQAFRDYVTRSSGRSHEEVDALLAVKRTKIQDIPRRIEAVARTARERGVALATHDDDSAAKVEQWPGLGATVSEFPTTMEAARRAHELGMVVCMGAPNVLRGRSSGGNLSALEAIQAGVTDALCADYYPIGMLAAPFVLAQKGVLSLPDAARLVSLNPARSVGLGDEFGSLEVGKVADVLVVRVNASGQPRVQRVFVDGREKVSIAEIAQIG